jgi:hypothetical protein
MGLGMPVRVVIQAADSVTGDGAAAYLLAVPERIELLPPEDPHADVLLVLARRVDDHVLARMRRPAGSQTRIVLVADELNPLRFTRAVEFGLAAFLARRTTDMSELLRTVERVRTASAMCRTSSPSPCSTSSAPCKGAWATQAGQEV